MDTVEEIKSKLDITTLISEYIELKRAGMNLKGRCPFHNEKTPSFFVNEERQRYHCFGCGEDGDIFNFIQQIEGVDFPEALKILAQKAGVEIKKFDKRTSSPKTRLLEICEIAGNYWQKNLNSEVGKKAKQYVEERKLNQETIDEFKIGYSEDSWNIMMDLLNSKKYNESEIFQAGLTVKKDKGSGYYDRFRDRLIFPIQDIHGNIVGFTGRTMKDENAKYINTPETPIYYKSKILYGLDKAKLSIRNNDYVVVVEGNMDVIACHQAGFKNVVACSGTALTPDQIRLLKRFTENIMLCFDTDEAGQRAAERSIELIYEEEMNVKIVELISGKDPDDCIKEDKENWVKSLKLAKAPMQHLIDKYITEETLRNIVEKKKATAKLLNELKKIRNQIERDFWIKELSSRIGVDVNTLQDILRNNIKPAKVVTKVSVRQNQPLKVEFNNIERLLAIVLNMPKFMDKVQERLTPDMIESVELNQFYKNLILVYNKNKNNKDFKFSKQLNESENQIDESYLNSLFICVDEIYVDFSAELFLEELDKLILSIKKQYFQNKISYLNNLLAMKEKAGDDNEINELIKQIQFNTEQYAQLK